jgi:hypothetical protein
LNGQVLGEQLSRDVATTMSKLTIALLSGPKIRRDELRQSE